MATTSPDGLYSPNEDTPVDFVADWAASMSSVQTALTNRRVKTGTSSERLAATGVREGSLWYDSTTTSLWAFFGSSWVEITQRAPLIQNLSAQNGWTAVGNPRVVVYDRIAYFQGGFTRGSASPYTTATVLPSWARPSLGTAEFSDPRSPSTRVAVFSSGAMQPGDSIHERSTFSWYVG